jgi:hypothetical protein
MTPITDAELDTFKAMHQCPNTRPEGGCQKCAMVARIDQLKKAQDALDTAVTMLRLCLSPKGSS